MSSKKAPIIYFNILHNFLSRMWLFAKCDYHLGHNLDHFDQDASLPYHSAIPNTYHTPYTAP